MSNISLVKSNQSYHGALKVLKPYQKELAEKIKDLPQIVIKINFVTVRKELATTPFATVKAFIDFIKPFYTGKIIIAEEATIGETEEGFAKYGFASLAENNPQVEVFNSAKDKVKEVKIEYPHGELILPLARIYTDSPFVVSICRAKTHDTVVATLAVKNLLVGAIQGSRSMIHQGKDIHWILAAIAEDVYPDFALIDSVIGMEGNGPINGTPIKAGWLVASFDALAADTLAAQIMGFNIKDIGYLNLLAKKGFGKVSPPPPFTTPFQPHRSFEEQKNWHP